jgi:copper(I)-binding protein
MGARRPHRIALRPAGASRSRRSLEAHMSSRRVATLLVVLLIVIVAACGSGSSATTGASGAASGSLTVTGAWVRTAPTGADTAAYFTIVNGTAAADSLVGVSTTISRSAGLHQTTTDPSGITGMQMTQQVDVPAGATVPFAPGGYHVMLVGVVSELKAGDQVVLQLAFEKAGIVKVIAEVRAS